MRKLIFGFLLLLCILGMNSVFAENIKFIQVTDVHLSTGSEYSQKVLESAVKDINQQEGVSFVVFTGDNINHPTQDNLRMFNKIISKLNVPYYVVLGNDDVYKSQKMSKTRFYEILREGHPFFPQKTPNYKFTKNGFVFLIVDGAKEVIPGTIGYYREDTLKWVDETLSKNEKKPVIIFQHFPVEYPQGSESRLKTHKTHKVEKYREILDKHHNVLAIISGHFHSNSESMKNGVYHISSPSLLVVPQSYKIIDIVTTKDFSPLIYTQLREFEVEK